MSLKQNALRLTLLCFFIVVIPMAFVGFEKYKNIELRPYFDLLFVFLFLLSLTRISRTKLHHFRVYWVTLIVFTISYLLNTIMQIGLSPFVVPTLKILLYFLIILTVASSNLPISSTHIGRYFSIVVYIVFTKYTISLILGLNTRPIFFTENNFEVIFFTTVFLYSLYQPYFFRNNKLFRTVSLSTILMSGSSSGALGLVSSFIFLTFKRALKNPLIFVIGMMLSIIPMYILALKFGGGLERIDRYQYIIASISSFTDRSFLELLFGPGYVKPMAFQTCNALSYLDTKITPDGRCFSSILSIGLLRQILDFGLIPLLLAHLLLFRVFRFYNLSKAFSLTLLILVSANGLSVSGLGNQFWILSVLFIIYAQNRYELKKQAI